MSADIFKNIVPWVLTSDTISMISQLGATLQMATKVYCMLCMWIGGCPRLENDQFTHEFSVGHEPPCVHVDNPR